MSAVPGAARRLLPLVGPALVVGVVCALVLVGVSAAAHLVEEVLWGPRAWWWTVVVLTAGGLLTGLIVRYVPGHAGHDPATEGLVGNAPLPLKAVPGLLAALFVTLAFGVSLGPEAPTIGANVALAAALGVRVMPRVPGTVWVALALAGTIGAMFGTPVAAALMLSEIPARNPQEPLWDRMVAPVVAAAAGALTVHFLEPGMAFALDVPPYVKAHAGDLVTAAVIAAVGCLLGMAMVYLLPRFHRVAHTVRNPVVLLTLGGLVLGVLGVIGGRITLFKGLDEMQELARDPAAYPAGQLALIIVVKTAALLVAAAVGFRGGRIFPSAFIGVALGLLAAALPWPDVPLALAVSAGAMGVCVAVSRSGWLSLFLGVVLGGSVALVPVLCVAILPAWLIATGRPEMRVAPEAAATGRA
ncbi:ion channel protein [Actinocorallia sp. API 0066]|uniref:ion channel protein n=1 Tax=Actinocorallia sp. API 0066 TaxID=2896846 RepID=UPI001E5A3D2C|nr:ion channel protein [Actinocorallia sp. API 0066]MCD0448815.1 ion channel protein [Actinocorallia sp. API 0066]